MAKSTFTTSGLNVKTQDQDLTYLYGISDFWVTVFEDENLINSFLEATTLQLSEIYSKFLQLTSTLSLSDIQISADSQVRLLVLNSKDQISTGVNEFKLPEKVLGCNYISNRPFLPSLLLENNVNFTLGSDGTTVQFDRDISTMPIPNRLAPDGSIEYALWVSDAKLDEEWIYKYYGKLVKKTNSTSTAQYKDLIQGLFYLYSNGPNIKFMRRGLNLVMGVPLARDTERVLQVNKVVDTNEWIVVTNSNAYLVPYGFKPNLTKGQILRSGDELVSWITVDDYRTKDQWWINLSMPRSIVENPPEGSQIIKKDSDMDFLMKTYLKNHTFLVQINTAGVGNRYLFENIREVTETVKPSYTHAIYVWAVPLEDEIIDLNDDMMSVQGVIDICDNVAIPDIRTFRRDTLSHCRCCPEFIRTSIPPETYDWLTKFTWETAIPLSEDTVIEPVRTQVLLSHNLANDPSFTPPVGYDSPGGYRLRDWNGEVEYPELYTQQPVVDGHIAPQYVWAGDHYLKSFMHTLVSRSNINGHLRRGHINHVNRELYFTESVRPAEVLDFTFGLTQTFPVKLSDTITVQDSDLLYLYCARKSELVPKLSYANSDLSAETWAQRYIFLPNSDVTSEAYKQLLVRGNVPYVSMDPGEKEVPSSIHANHYFKLKREYYDPTFLSAYLPRESYKCKYFDVQNIPAGCVVRIVLVHVVNDVYAIHLVQMKSDYSEVVPFTYMLPQLPMDGVEELKISARGTAMHRGGMNMDAPVYFGRFSYDPRYLDVQTRSETGTAGPNYFTRSGAVNFNELLGSEYEEFTVPTDKNVTSAKRL